MERNRYEIYISMMRPPSASLTFTDAVATWSDAMKTKQMGAIDEMLSQEFTWDSVNNEYSTSRKDTMEWIASRISRLVTLQPFTMAGRSLWHSFSV